MTSNAKPGEQDQSSSQEQGAGGSQRSAIKDAFDQLNTWDSQHTQPEQASSFPSDHDPQTDEQIKRLRKLNGSDTAGSSPTLRKSPRSRSGSHGNEQFHKPNLPWRERIKHTTWAYFTLTMATGGIANVLHSVPWRPEWLHIVGLIFFFVNIVFYLIIWGMILARFITTPGTFRSSLVHPTESLFVPAVTVSFGTICITIVEYGADNTGFWLTEVVWILFWINVFLAIFLSITIYMILWSSLTFTIAQMTPIWIFPAYPLLIIGPHAANLSAKLHNPQRSLQVIVAGFTVQGIGFLVSLTIYSAFVYRLMTQKLPADPARPGMFVSVGPAAFTCSGTIGMAANLQHAIVGSPGNKYMDVDALFAAQILRLIANWTCLWFWGLAIWFFFVSLVSNVAPLYSHGQTIRTKRSQQHKDKPRTESEGSRSSDRSNKVLIRSQEDAHTIPFQMTWYSYIFPQTALTTATFRIADAFDMYPVKIIGCVMTCLLIAMWSFVVFMMFRAIVKKDILWPEKGEDREEGGYKRPRLPNIGDHPGRARNARGDDGSTVDIETALAQMADGLTQRLPREREENR